MKYAKAVLVLTGFVLGVALTGHADNTVCIDAILLVPDGSILEGTFTVDPQFRWFVFLAKPNRSYAIMVDNLEPRDVSQVISISNVVDGCGGSAITTTQREDTEPASRLFLGSSNRQSERKTIVMAPTAASTTVVFRLGGNGGNFRVRVEETTLYNPLWSTFGGFETFYRFQNTTNASCNVTLRLVNDAGTQVANDTFSLSANSTTNTRNTGPSDLNVADNQAGQATITHNCPPGAIQVDGFLGIFTGSQSSVLPIRIQTARQMR